MDEIKLPEGLAPEVVEKLSTPEMQEVLKGIVTPLIGKRDELLGRLATQKQQFDEFGGYDTIKTKLSTYDQAEQAKREAEQQAALASTDVEAKTKALQDIIDGLRGKVDGYEKERVKSHVQSQVQKVFVADDGVTDLDIAAPHIERMIKHVVGADGNIAIQVFKEDGSPLLTEDGKDGTLKDLKAYMRNSAKFSQLYKASNKAGSGAKSTTTGGASVDNPWAKNTPAYNVTKQMEMYRNQPEMAKVMAAQYGVKL